MFSQIFLTVVAVFLIYIGIVGGSVINIIIGTIGLLISLARFYALKSGLSLHEQFEQWCKKAIQKGSK